MKEESSALDVMFFTLTIVIMVIALGILIFMLSMKFSSTIAPEELTLFEKNIEKIKPFIWMGVLINVGTLIWSIIINTDIHIKSNSKKIKKDLYDLESPILAESIIDGKIGVKELMMTAIIDLSAREKIKISIDDVVELVNTDGLKRYEKEIIELIFDNKKRINIEDINKILGTQLKKSDILNTKEKTNSISDSTIIENINYKMEKVRKSILKELYNSKIFSKTLTIYSKIANLIVTLITLNLLFFIGNNNYVKMNNFSLVAYLLILASNIMVIKLFATSIKFDILFSESLFRNIKQSKIKRKSNNIYFYSIVFILMLFVIINNLIDVIIYNSELFILFTIMIISSIIVLTLNNRIYLTTKGMNERKKLIELKNYIKQYNFIEKRKLSKSSMWNEYLAYTTAFRISNNITKEIYENWYNVNRLIKNIGTISKIIFYSI